MPAAAPDKTPSRIAGMFDAIAPRYDLLNHVLSAGLDRRWRDRAVDALMECGAVFMTSNTLVGEGEREISLAVRERALQAGKHIVFDPNLRLHRWESPGRAASEARAFVKDAFLVKLNATEARLLSGEDDPEKAASAREIT